MTERDWLNIALDSATNLERGLALCCSPIVDEDQKAELLRCKHAILEALDLNGKRDTDI